HPAGQPAAGHAQRAVGAGDAGLRPAPVGRRSGAARDLRATELGQSSAGRPGDARRRDPSVRREGTERARRRGGLPRVAESIGSLFLKTSNPSSTSRRHLFKSLGAATLAVVALPGCDPGQAAPAQASAYVPAFFTPDEWRFLRAASARLIPSDGL